MYFSAHGPQSDAGRLGTRMCRLRSEGCKVRVQGADRREWWSPFQGLERSNRTLSGFPEGEIDFLGNHQVSRHNARFI